MRIFQARLIRDSNVNQAIDTERLCSIRYADSIEPKARGRMSDIASSLVASLSNRDQWARGDGRGTVEESVSDTTRPLMLYIACET